MGLSQHAVRLTPNETAYLPCYLLLPWVEVVPFFLYEHTWVGQAHAIINTTRPNAHTSRKTARPPRERPMFWVGCCDCKKNKTQICLLLILLRLQQQRYYTCRRHGRLLCDRLVTTQAARDRQRAQESHMSYTREGSSCGARLLSVVVSVKTP